ncbi:methyltransferase family protein [Chitinophaga skermanii]|uniref:Methyltransferase family protein n=1 Tax=Chitinophaga skermanii TaxID=331697 RepID=A0A327QXT9_9BACT|nr:class I SAM-dependent methyltransferase [Chitinophaga skermanii]RAJ08544.1 methyltransferase family protein [Chitinophaga skermanii]
MTNPFDMDEQQAKDLAAQLGKPQGEDGLKVADHMHVNNGEMSKHAIDVLNISEQDVILEIGPGNGGHAPYAIAKAAGTTYYGIDISATMVAAAKEKNTELIAANRAHFQLGDGITLPYQASFFNKVFTVNTLYFWQDYAQQLAEINRVMQPGGILCIAIRSKSFMEKLPFTKFGFRMFEANDVITLLLENGFTPMHVVKATEEGTTNSGEKFEKDRLLILATPVKGK